MIKIIFPSILSFLLIIITGCSSDMLFIPIPYNTSNNYTYNIVNSTNLTFQSITNLGNGSYLWNFSDNFSYTTGNLTGSQGIPGINGINGTNGTNGLNGTDGSDGADGTSVTFVSITNNGNGTYQWLFSDGTNYTTGNLTGMKGEIGNGSISPVGSYINITGLYIDANLTAFDSRYNLSNYVPYNGANQNVNLGYHNLTLNGTINWQEQTGVQNLFYINPLIGDGFRMEYWYNFELANDDWLVFRKTDGNDANPDGGIAFMMSNTTHNWSVLKIDGYKLANFTDYNILTTGNVSASNLYNKIEIDAQQLAQNNTINLKLEANQVQNGSSNLTLAIINAQNNNGTVFAQASGICTYGIANYSIGATTSSITCAGQQGTSNLTLSQVAVDIVNSTIIHSGNTSWITSNQLTYQNGSSNLTLTQVTTANGNYSGENGSIIHTTNTSWVRDNQYLYQNGSSNLTLATINAQNNNGTVFAQASGICTYGIANYSIGATTSSITCAGQQGTSNLTLSQVAVDIVNSTIIHSGNTSWITSNQLTYQNGSSNLTIADINTSSYYLHKIEWANLLSMPTWNNYTLSQIVTAIGNWSLDKPNYQIWTTTKAYIDSIGNWTADKPSYTVTSGLVGILGNWSLDKPNYLTAGQVQNGSSNLTLAIINAQNNNGTVFAQASGICTYGIANYSIGATTSSITCAGQQRTANLTGLVMNGNISLYNKTINFYNSTGGNLGYIYQSSETSPTLYISTGLILLSSLRSDGDLYTTGSGDDLWLGTSTQSSALFRAYANGSLNTVNLNTVGLIYENGTSLNTKYNDSARIDTLNLTKSNLASPTFTGTATFANGNFTGTVWIVNINSTNENVINLNISGTLTRGTVSDTEFSYLDGVTSSIQTQLNTKGTGIGNVSSVTCGTGLTGGTITTTGTCAVNSTIISSTAQVLNAQDGRLAGRQTGAGNGLLDYLTASQSRSVIGLGSMATENTTSYATTSELSNYYLNSNPNNYISQSGRITSGSKLCYQESFNISNQTGIDDNCDLNYTGIAKYTTSDFNNINNFFDGNYTSYITTVDFTEKCMYINYSNPYMTFNAIWKNGYIKSGITTSINSTIFTNCTSQNITQLKKCIQRDSSGNGTYYHKNYCNDGINFIQLETTLSEFNKWSTDEAIIWNVTNYISADLNITGSLLIQNLTGVGNAVVCVDTNGLLYRGNATGCP